MSVRDGGGNSIEFALFGKGASFCGLGGGGVGCDCGTSSFSRLISGLLSLVLLPYPQC